MEFGSQEDHFTKDKFIPSSSSSSSLHKMTTASWLATKYELEPVSVPGPEDFLTSRSNTSFGTASAKLEFMDIVNEDEEHEEAAGPVEKEHMFDKVVTPSDVGKLNRLVIPKQHAEKYFPLHSTANEKGLLLNFEDRIGKAWRFRYSYWNSSQSYVMTKGWSRFVKDKKLDAGDIVSFQRGIGDSVKDRFFIDWRHRPDSAADYNPHRHHFQHHYLSSIPWSPLLMRPPEIVYMRPAQPQVVQWPRIGDGGGGGSGGVVKPMVYESVPVVEGKAAAKRLRLFGVNMDCPLPTESEQCELRLSSSSLQLKVFNGNPIHKGKSSMSFDLDI